MMRHTFTISPGARLWIMLRSSLSLALATALAACPDPTPPGPPPVPAPPPTFVIAHDLARPLSVIATALPGGGTRVAMFSLPDQRLVVVDHLAGVTTEVGRASLPETATMPQMVFSPDGDGLFVSGTARDHARARTRPLQRILDLTTTPVTVKELDELGFARQIAWGRREIVVLDGTVTELDPTYGTPNVARRCTPATCGTIDRRATRLVTGDEHTLQSVRPWPSLQPGPVLERVDGASYLGRLGDRWYVGPGVDGVRSPIYDAHTGELALAVPGSRFETAGEVVVASSSGHGGEGASALDVHLPATGAHVRLGFVDDGAWTVTNGLLIIAGDPVRAWDLTALARLAAPTAPAPALAPGVDVASPWAAMLTRGHRFAATRDPHTGHALARPATCRVVWSGTWREDEPVPASWVACRDAAAPADPSVDPASMDRWAGLWVLRGDELQRADGAAAKAP